MRKVNFEVDETKFENALKSYDKEGSQESLTGWKTAFPLKLILQGFSEKNYRINLCRSIKEIKTIYENEQKIQSKNRQIWTEQELENRV